MNRFVNISHTVEILFLHFIRASCVYLQVKTGYTDDKDFDPEKVKKGSVAAAGLCKWVHAMVVYNRVAKVVGPKRAALAEAESTLAQAMSDLGEKRAMLKVFPARSYSAIRIADQHKQ